MSTLPGHDHTSNSTPSLEGRGVAYLASKDKKSMKRTGLNHGVPYPKGSTPGLNGLIHSCSILPSIHQTWCIRIKTPLYHNDHFISHIPTKSFAPPHTVASIKRFLCKFEGLSEPDKVLVFTLLWSPHPKKTLPTSLFMLLLGPAYLKKTRSH